MAKHKCPKCSKIFKQKSHLNKHLNNKNPCINNINKLKCEHCDKLYSRKDSLKRHMDKIHIGVNKNKLNVNNNHINNNTGNINIHNNNITIKNNNNIHDDSDYFFVYPFGKEEIDKLTADDKLKFFTSQDDPIMMIFIKTNINPDFPEYHNVGYFDTKCGYGCIYNGNTWLKKRINSIVDNIICSKHKHLFNIGESVKSILGYTQNDFVDTVLGDIKRIAEPIDEFDIKCRKKLENNIKTNLYNNKHLANESIKKTNKSNNDKIILDRKVDIDHDDMKKLLGNMTIEEFREKFEIYNRAISLKKSLAIHLLNRIKHIDESNYDLINDKINNTIKLEDINIIIKSLNRCLFFVEVNYDILQKQIQLESEINNFITIELN